MSPSVRTSILRMVAQAFPALVYGYPRTYVVEAVRDDKRLDLRPLPDAAHLPELLAVEQWGLGEVTPVEGAEVCVLFRDANPERPIVVPWGPGTTPEEVAIDADDVLLGAADGVVIREGDTISITPGNGAGVVAGVVTVTLGLGVPPAKSKVKA